MPHKVLSRGGSFGEPTDVPSVLWAWLVRNLERLVEELVYHRVLTGRIAVWVGYRDGRAGEGRATLQVPTNRFDALLETYRPCLRSAWIPRTLASRMHLFAEELTPDAPRQLGLFDRDEDDAATAVKQAINQKHGRFALRSARDAAAGADLCRQCPGVRHLRRARQDVFLNWESSLPPSPGHPGYARPSTADTAMPDRNS